MEKKKPKTFQMQENSSKFIAKHWHTYLSNALTRLTAEYKITWLDWSYFFKVLSVLFLLIFLI